MATVLRDFNSKSEVWCQNDTTSHEGSMIDALTSNYGLFQLIPEPTYIINTSCYQYLLHTHTHLFLKTGVYFSAYLNFHHQMFSAKFNLSVLYPSLYKITMWYNEKKNDHDLFGKAID